MTQVAYGRTTPLGDDSEFEIQSDATADQYGLVNTCSRFQVAVPAASAFARTSAGAESGITATTFGTSPMALTTVFELYNVAVSITDDTTSGSYGTVKLGDFVAGRIAPFGGQVELFTATASGDVAADATYEVGVGSAATAAAGALTTTADDLVTGLATGDASSSTWSALSLDGVSLAGTTSLDGASTAIPINLNFGTASDAEASGDGTITISRATIVVHWGYVGTN